MGHREGRYDFDRSFLSNLLRYRSPNSPIPVSDGEYRRIEQIISVRQIIGATLIVLFVVFIFLLGKIGVKS